MARLNDLLHSEQSDAERAAAMAAAGRSMTGLSGRLFERDHAAPEGPIYGERVTRQLPGMTEPQPFGGLQPVGRHINSGRERVPFGDNEQQLAYPKRPGYRRYWFVEVPGRIQRAREAGYEHVRNPQTGEPVSLVTDRVDTGGRRSYLMEIPIELYAQDMALAAARLDARLREIKEGRFGPGAQDSRYIPQQGISVIGR